MVQMMEQIKQGQVEQYRQTGYTVASGLFSAQEAADYAEYYTAMRLEQNKSEEKVWDDSKSKLSDDPLRTYGRLMHPHRYDQHSLDWLLGPRIASWLTALLGKAPYAVQTMVYFKPAGSRGQALHQDQFYLRVQPGTCIAAWMALDDCDEENGCLQLVPGTQNIPVLCSVDSDPTQSFTDDTVVLPPGMTPAPVTMKAGDVLFFNGQVVHGSYGNTSKDRFRRSLIAHYIDGEAEQVSRWYKPVLRLDGTEVILKDAEWGGRCGVFVDKDGNQVVEITGAETRQNYTIH